MTPSKVVGDHQRSGIERPRIESPGRWPFKSKVSNQKAITLVIFTLPNITIVEFEPYHNHSGFRRNLLASPFAAFLLGWKPNLVVET